MSRRTSRRVTSAPVIKFESDSSSDQTQTQTQNYRARKPEEGRRDGYLRNKASGAVESNRNTNRNTNTNTESDTDSQSRTSGRRKNRPAAANVELKETYPERERYGDINDLHTELQASLQAVPCKQLLRQLKDSKRAAEKIAEILESHTEVQRTSLSKSKAAEHLCRLALCLADLDDALRQLHDTSQQSPDFIVRISSGRFFVQLDLPRLQNYPVLHFVGIKAPTGFLLQCGKKSSKRAKSTGPNFLQVTGQFVTSGLAGTCTYESVERKSRKTAGLYDSQAELALAFENLLTEHLGVCSR